MSLLPDGVDSATIDGVRYASGFSGSDGGEQIQDAVDDLPDDGGRVVIGPEGPDDVTGRSGVNSARADNAWDFSSPVTLPDYVTIDAQAAYLTSTSRAPFFRNESFGGSGTNEQITLDLRGSWLDMAPSQYASESSDHAIEWDGIEEWWVLGGVIGPTLSFGIFPEDAYDGLISGVHVNNRGSFNIDVADDFVHITGPAERITVANCTGFARDDLLVCDTGPGAANKQGSGGTVEDITFANNHMRGNPDGGGDADYFKTIPGTGTLQGVRVVNGSYEATNAGNMMDIGDSRSVSAADHQGITIDNCHIRLGGPISVSADVQDLRITNNTIEPDSGPAIGYGGARTVNGSVIANNRFFTDANTRIIHLRDATFRGVVLRDNYYARTANTSTKGVRIVTEATNTCEIDGVKIINETFDDIPTAFEVGSGVDVLGTCSIQNPTFNSVGTRYDDKNGNGVFGTEQDIEINGYVGGRDYGGVDLSSLNGQYDGQLAIANGTSDLPADTVCRWNGSNWRVLNPVSFQYTGDGSTGRTLASNFQFEYALVTEAGSGSAEDAYAGNVPDGTLTGNTFSGELTVGVGITVGDNSGDSDPNTNNETYDVHAL